MFNLLNIRNTLNTKADAMKLNSSPTAVNNTNDYYAKRGLEQFSNTNNFVNHLTNTAQSLGLGNVQANILHDASQSATTWLLSGREALQVFHNNSNSESKQGLLSGIFNFFTQNQDVSQTSILKNFYTKSQEANSVDNLGESWEHFQRALEMNHYSLMPVYDSKSTSYQDPVAFAVFERFFGHDKEKKDLFDKLSMQQCSLQDLPSDMIYLDKYLMKNSFDRGLDMKSFERNVIGAYMNFPQNQNAILVIPWQVDPLRGLNLQTIKGITHAGFSKRGSKIEITPKHVINGQAHHVLKADSLISKFPLSLSSQQAKALTLAGTINEITAGPELRLKSNMFRPVKNFVEENFKSIDQHFESSSNSSSAAKVANLFNWFTKLFRR